MPYTCRNLKLTALFVSAVTVIHSNPYYWISTTSNDWTSTSSWTGGAWPQDPIDQGTFQNVSTSGTITVTLTEPIDLNGLYFVSMTNPYYIEGATSSDTLTFSISSPTQPLATYVAFIQFGGQAANQINVPIVLGNTDLLIAPLDGTSTINAGISGSYGVNVEGNYTIPLTFNGSGDYTYTGDTTVARGYLAAGDDDVFSSASSFFVNSYGTLDVANTEQTIANLASESDVTSSQINIGDIGSLTFGNSESTKFYGSFSASGGAVLIKQGSGTFTANTSSSTVGTTSGGGTTVSAGTMVINSPLWTGPFAVSSSATLRGTGTIAGDVTLSNLSTLAPGSGSAPGTLTLSSGSTVTFADTSIYRVRINSSGASKLIVSTDTAVDGTLTASVPTSYAPEQKTYTIMKTSSGSLTGTFSSIAPPAGYTMVPTYFSDKIRLTFSVTELDTSELSGNQKKLANYFNEMPTELLYLNQLSLDELEDALNSISFARNYSSGFALQNTAYSITAQVTKRLGDHRLAREIQQRNPNSKAATTYAMMAASDTISTDNNDQNIEETPLYRAPFKKDDNSNYQVWISGFGQYAHQDSTASGQNPAFNFNAQGGLIGVDWLSGDAVAGFSGGYARNTIDMHNSSGHGSTNIGFVMLYGGYVIDDFFFDGSFLTGMGWFENRRHITFSGFNAHAKSNHTGWMIDPHLDFGYHADFDWGALEPYASFDGAVIFEEEFTENGASPFNFNQSSRNAEMLRSEIGLAGYQDFDFGTDGFLMLRESVSYVNKTPWGDINAAIVGSSSNVSLVTITGTQNLFSPTFEILYNWEDFTFSAMYEGEFGSNYNSNEVLGQFSYQF